jgi:perosamine synthetase
VKASCEDLLRTSGESLAPLPFSIAFDPRDEEEVMRRWRLVLRSNKWSHGEQLEEFEQEWAAWNGMPAVGFDNWAGAAMAALDFFQVRGQTVLCPSNTFLATPRSAELSGAKVVFYDCNRHDLCASFEDFVAKAEATRPALAFVVHVGGHLAFDIRRIAAYCREKGIRLIEDCAHAVGADWNGQKPGGFGDVGLFSLYATKTISTGEGGVAVTADQDLLKHLRSYRDYGRGSGYRVKSLNHRMDEFRAAFGTVQLRRMPEIVAWKQAYARDVLDPLYPDRVRFPDGMASGYYKYIVFQPISNSTGKVYEQPCHRLMRAETDLPNADWVATNHWCVPLYYPREAQSERI